MSDSKEYKIFRAQAHLNIEQALWESRQAQEAKQVSRQARQIEELTEVILKLDYFAGLAFGS